MRSRSRQGQPAYRRDGATWLIEIQLDEVGQLFDTLDPAPFHRKDLDPAAAQYLEDAVREIGSSRPLRLVVHLPPAQATRDDARTLPEAVANYFGYRADESRVELRRLLGRGAASLAIGVAFLAFCLSLRNTLLAAAVGGEVMTEGLLIIGWVGLWRPVEIFLYDWWPVWRRRRRFEVLAEAGVEIAMAPG